MKNANSAMAYLFVITTFLFSSAVPLMGQKKQSKNELATEVEKWKKTAEEANARAAKAEAAAAQAARVAVAAQQAAERAEASASRARYIALAKAMALKSAELTANPEQQALVALQAFKFTAKYQGNPLDNDIYNGLVNALFNVKSVSTQSLAGGDVRLLASCSKTGEVYSASGDGTILKWSKNETGWRSENVIGVRKHTIIHAMAASADGSFLAASEGTSTGNSKHVIAVYDLRSSSGRRTTLEGFPRINAIAYAPSGDRLYLLEAEGRLIKLAPNGGEIKTKERINAIALSPDGKMLVGASASGRVYAWDVTNKFLETISYQNEGEVMAITFAPDGERMVIGDMKGRLVVFSLRSSAPGRVLTGHTASIKQILFDHSGNFLATKAVDGIRIWNWSRLTMPPLVLKDGAVNSNIAFSPDDQQLWVASGDKNESIQRRPLQFKSMCDALCSSISRNMTKEEWENFVGSDLPYEQTCEK